MNEPVLLKSGFGELGAIIFIVISILSWVINYINEQKKNQRRPQRPAPQQPPRAQQPRAQQPRAQQPRVQQRHVPAQQHLQNEIDLFLQKTGGNRQIAEPIIEIIPEDDFEDVNRPRRLVDESQHTFDSHLEDRHIGEKNLGSGIQQHVTSHAGSDELDFIVEQHMDDRVDDSVQSHLGSFSGDDAPARSTRSEMAEQIFRLFQTPRGVRQAIVMQEVLTRKKFS